MPGYILKSKSAEHAVSRAKNICIPCTSTPAKQIAVNNSEQCAKLWIVLKDQQAGFKNKRTWPETCTSQWQIIPKTKMVLYFKRESHPCPSSVSVSLHEQQL